MKPLILFHANCTDGFTAAWVAWRHFNREAEIRAVSHGDAPPDVTGRDVFILDFSYPRETLLAMSEKANDFLVLDHHKTAEAALADLPFCQFDMTRSGAGMAWDYFNPGQPRPALVKYVEDRDLWRWAFQGSKAVSAFTHSVKRDLVTWDGLAKMSAEEMAFRGEAILAYQEVLIDQLVRNAKEITIDGHRVLAVNSPVLQSEIGERLAKDRPFGAVWFERSDGCKQWSLRSRPPTGIDVSEVAKRHGGGGHAQAAGFNETPGPTATQHQLNAVAAAASELFAEGLLECVCDGHHHCGACKMQHALTSDFSVQCTTCEEWGHDAKHCRETP